jgi:tetratricopeptide (TPR) repeat protein
LLQALYGRATVYRTAGDYKSAMTDLDRLSDFCHEVSFSPHNSIYLKSRIDYAHLLSLTAGNHARAKKIITDLMSRVKGKIGIGDRAHGLNTLGIIQWLDAKNEEALRSLRKAISIYKQKRDLTGISRCLGAMGVIYQQKGKFEMALKLFKEDLAITKRNSDILGIGVALNHLGMVYHGRGVYNTALKYFKMNLNISERIGYKRGIALSCNNIGIIYRLQDKLDMAKRFFERALEDSRAIGFQMMTSTVSNSIGLIQHDEYRFRAALKYFNQGLDAARKGGYKMGVVISHGNLGLVYRDQKKYSEALASYEASRAFAREIGDPLGTGYAHFGIASVRLASKQTDGVLEHLKRAERIFARLGEKARLSETYAHLANHYCNVNRFARARESAQKALALARDLNLKRELLLALRSLGRSWMPLSRSRALAFYKESVDLGKKWFNDKEFKQTFAKLKSLGL